jgi:hypothetical protein
MDAAITKARLFSPQGAGATRGVQALPLEGMLMHAATSTPYALAVVAQPPGACAAYAPEFLAFKPDPGKCGINTRKLQEPQAYEVVIRIANASRASGVRHDLHRFARQGRYKIRPPP